MNVAGDLLDLGGTFFQIQFYVAVDVFHGNIAVLGGNLNFSVATSDGDIALAAGDVHFHFAGDGNIQIALHGMVAGGLSLGIENHYVARKGDLGLGLLIVFVGVVLAFRADAFADDDGDFVVVGDADSHRAVIVIDAQAGSGGGYILFQMIVEVIASGRKCYPDRYRRCSCCLRFRPS